MASRQFSYADSLKRVLRYICENASRADGRTVKEHEIASQALNRPDSFDPKLDPVVRVSMTHIRERLRAYFETEGKDEPIRLLIPKGQYRAVFDASENPSEHRVAGPALPTTALRRFWQPYIEPGAYNAILHTHPLFLRDDTNGNYLRNLYVNDRATWVEDLAKRDPAMAERSLSPSFHYLSCGEVYCIFSISHMFHELNARLETRNARIFSWNEARHANLILLGCARTNTFMDELQGDAPFTITDDAIEVADPRPPEHPRYEGTRYLDGKLRRFTDYALISRRPGPAPERAVTVIASNHGNAVQGAGHYLALEDRVAELLDRMHLGRNEPLPAQFQIIMRVDMIDVDDEVVHVEYVTHRFPGDGRNPAPNGSRGR